jgi:outer membrane protein
MKHAIFLFIPFIMAVELGAQPRRLSLADAIQATLENNVDVAIAGENAEQARARVQEQRSALLPNIDAVGSQTHQTVNLNAIGIQLPPGTPIPTRVTFNLTDGRFRFAEPVLDLSLIRQYQSSKHSANASQFDADAIKNQVVAMVSNLYYGVQRARGVVEANSAQIELDQALLRLAQDRREGGVGTGLDVTRAESRLASDRHDLLAAQNESRTAELRLLRTMGARLDTAVELTDSLSSTFETPPALSQAIQLAFQNRPEMKAEQKRLDAARLARGATHAERLPSIQSFADYGGNGQLNQFVSTDRIGLQITLPIFDGGRRSAHMKIAESQFRQTEARAKDLHDAVELEVRVAFDTVNSAREQLAAAESTLKLAQEELDLSRLRYEAQVTTQIDVISAQAELAAARSRRVNALFAVKSSEIELRRSMGER